MKLESLLLKNFRVYQKIELEFPTRLTFITGRNGSGKTSILEAISILSNGKSFRGVADEILMKFGEESYFTSCNYKRNQMIHTIDVGCENVNQKTKRRIRLNNKNIASRSSLIGNLITVIFSPDDLNILEGGPSERRKFIDFVISNQDSEYLNHLLLYHRALKQRNMLLKTIRENQSRISDLDVWDKPLLEYGKKISAKRVDFLKNFSPILDHALERISDGKDSLQCRIVWSNYEEENHYEIALKNSRWKDVKAGFTTCGPHRQNFVFEKSGREITEFGSQGQKRSFVLALRIAQFYFLKNFLSLSPLLLIDDVIRELDTNRRGAFVQLLHECGQAIFTTPDLDGMDVYLTALKDEIRIIKINDDGLIVQ